MAHKIKVGAVSYLNTKPLIYGFEQGMMKNEIDLVFDYPANIARGLQNKQIDIGLVPVVVIPSLPQHFIISDYCIGSEGEVASVCLFSDVPINEITTVLLDYQSNTSVALLKILMRSHWHISPVEVAAGENYEKNIKGTVAGLVIGDRALEQRTRSKYIYDLGLAWTAMTGLPFVFAAWVSNKPIDDAFKLGFNAANAYGLQHLPDVIKNIQHELFDLEAYYTRYISYQWDVQKEAGMKLFFKYISDINV